ncbi:MAG TPA: ATP-binding protein [Acidimicrobiales bacterium]|nr:ATP-binding protein [Acidimicrobiales bacterium]
MRNPFTPTFGVSPPLLVGRDDLIDEFGEALAEGPGSAARATLYTGARGSGKTVMLNAVEDRARELGWVVVNETASPGFVGRIVREQLPQLLRSFDPKAVRRAVTGIVGPLGTGGISWTKVEAHVAEAGLRGQIELLTDLLKANETGLLITLDEIHPHQTAELRDLATAVQHSFREGRELAFAGAGLSSAVSDVLNDEVLTFLRRAERHALGTVERGDVERALREPIEAAGRTVSDEAVRVMAGGTGGYPFLIQLVGANTWRVHQSEAEITVDDAEKGVARALRRLGSLIYEPALADASDIDKSFLLAMAKDDGPSRMADLQQRLGVDMNYASQYRRRLIAAELIEPVRYGYVDFTLPYMREYLRDHAAHDV